MATRKWDPNAWEADPMKYGSAGLIWNSPQHQGSLTNGSGGDGYNFDPKYMRATSTTNGDGPDSQRYEPTEYFKKLLGGKIQVRDLKRLKDQNAVVDGGEEVGWLTDPSNYTDDEDWLDKFGVWALAAPLAASPFMHMAGLGGAGAAAGGAEAAGGAGLDLGAGMPGWAAEGGAAVGGGAAGGAAGGAGGLMESLGLGSVGIKDIIRGGLGLASLGGMVGGNGSAGGGGGSGSGDAQSIIDQMANANRVDMNTPLGSRKWNKGADGRWSVTDSMDPAEEANFRGVQGMNSDVTGMARQRLAEILANPKKRQGVSYGQFDIGG